MIELKENDQFEYKLQQGIVKVKNEEIKLEIIQTTAEPSPERTSDWKPMSFSTNTPDALISKKEEAPASERPTFNVSFFTQNVSALDKEEDIKPTAEDVKIVESIEESNVPDFINTWQSWLKIERPVPTEEVAKVKEKIIDNFIETNPKISQLKEESSYVVKEKKDDISHLMTETLAKLYTEQKLYSKAIKAYELLSEKHPDKKNYFEEKIEEIKEFRKS